uniref:Uncharacterized protein n=1 Tax=Gordonia phage Petito TaxID=3158876 RepID=A0AAU8GPS4_9CAUD
MSNCQSVSLETSYGDSRESSIFDRSMVNLNAVLTCACGHKTKMTVSVRQDVTRDDVLSLRAGRIVSDAVLDLQVLHEEKMMGR